MVLEDEVTRRWKYWEQRNGSSKSDSGSLKVSEEAILEVNPRKHAVKDKEQGFKKLRMAYKRHLKIQWEWRRPVFSYKVVLESSAITFSSKSMTNQRKV